MVQPDCAPPAAALSADSMCGAASRMRPPPAIPQPTTLLTTSPPGTTFSAKMTPAMTPIQARFIIPIRRSTNISGQLDPRQYIPCPSPARTAPRCPLTRVPTDGAAPVWGDRHWRRHACLRFPDQPLDVVL